MASNSRSVAAPKADARLDAVAVAALTTVRRALVDGLPVTRELLEREACVSLGASRNDAMRELDDVAQHLGISSLS
jgi:hypothetical protein